jgi:CRISPR/Cas system-associated exonuclease Cas4 (RecB family)
MQVLCSAGKGEHNHLDCLKCALETGQPPCGFDYTILRSMFDDTSSVQRRNEIHVTDLTGCLLKSFYDKVSPSAEYVHEKMSRWMGTHMHGVLEGSDEHVDSELPLAWDGIVGRADVVYKNGRVLDFKSTRWLIPDKLPYGSHEVQVNIYAYLLRKMGREVNRLQIQYIDMSGPTKCRACRVPVRMVEGELKCPQCNKFIANAHLGAVLVDVPMMTDAEIEFYVKDRKEALKSSIEMQFPPEAEPGYLCSYCPHYQQLCFPI